MNLELECATCRERLPWYVAGSLAAEERAEVERHLFICARCQRALGDWRAISALVQCADQMIPPDAHLRSGWEALAGQLPRQPRMGNIERQGGFEMEDTEQRIHEYPETVITPRADERPATSAASPARRRWLPAVAVTLLLLLLSSAFLGRLALQRGMGTSTSPTATATPVPVTVHQLRHNEILPRILLTDIQMLSPTEGWAVGYKQQVQKDICCYPEAVILHYRDGKWSQFGGEYAEGFFLTLSMDSPTDGWAGGINQAGDQTLLFHYTGGQWVRYSSPVTDSPPKSFNRIQMVSQQEGWAITGEPGTNNGDITRFAMLHYLNGSWSVVDTGVALWDFSMVSATEGWALGSDPGKPVMLVHYQHGQWVRVPSPVQAALLTVQMLSANDGWISGLVPSAYSRTTPQQMVLLHYDGTRWTQVGALPTYQPAVYATSLARSAFPSHDEGWIVGKATNQVAEPPSACNNGVPGCTPEQDTYEASVILHYAGGQWQMLPDEFNAMLWGVSMTSASDGWAVGTTFDPAPVMDIGSPSSAGVLLHYHNGAWTPYTGWGK